MGSRTTALSIKNVVMLPNKLSELNLTPVLWLLSFGTLKLLALCSVVQSLEILFQ